MSKLANRPVLYSSDIAVEVKDGVLYVSKNSKVEKVALNNISVEVNNVEHSCSFSLGEKNAKKENLGTVVSLFRAAVKNLNEPYSLNITTNGVGFKAMIVNNDILLMWLGRSHLYAIKFPKEVNVSAKDNKISLSGSKVHVTALAAIIKTNRKWDPCMQKGVVIEEEFLIKKEGKKKK